ncbi:MAG TPA: glycosyltransferase family 2 protein [Bryobacteraceae bacterium]|jgi:glycosyltransferase involved in cell wall biosynthesis
MADPAARLVSCIMATRDRRLFIPQALRCFSRQTYSESELIIVDDGREPVADLCDGIPRVRYIRLHKPATTGTKLNIGIERAQGEIVQKLDDDDYYHPNFLKLAVARLPSHASARTLVAWDCFLILVAGETRLRHSGHGWDAGGTFCFYRRLWEHKPFRDVAKNEDYWFVNDHRPRIRRVCAAEHYILVRHGRNTWQLISGERVDSYFQSLPLYPRALDALVPPEDLAFYRSLRA